MNKSLDGNLIKSAHTKQKFSEKDLEDILNCVDNPHYFLDNFFYIQHPIKGKIQYKAFSYQKRLIDSYHDHRFSVNMLGRQMGKTTTAAGYLLWHAMFIPDSTVLIAAHKYTGAQEIMNRIRYAYELCPDHVRAGVTSYNKQSIEFENGSRIVAQTTTETTGRGMSLSLLYCLDGDTSIVRIRNKHTLVEEDITLKDLYIRLLNPKKILNDEFAFVDNLDK